MDPVTTAVGVAFLTALAAAWRFRCRAVRAEAETDRLSGELHAERHAASHDPLTGLPNRRAFYQLGAALVADPVRRPLVAVVLDLDDFKQVNDTLGHAAGDHVLIVLARRLATCAGDNLVARLGGDEFAGLLASPGADDVWAYRLADRLAFELAAPIRIGGYLVRVTASIGVAPVDVPAHLAAVLSQADAAMYRAKATGHRAARATRLCDTDSTFPAGAAPAGAAWHRDQVNVDHVGVRSSTRAAKPRRAALPVHGTQPGANQKGER